MALRINHNVNKDYKTYLEGLFYNNPRQKFHINAIERMIEKYGEPRIIEKNGYIKMITNKCPESRSLFISQGPILIGVLIYHRNTPNNIEIIHTALNTEYINNDELQLMDLLKKCINHLNIQEVQTFSIGYLESRSGNNIYFNVN